MFLGSTRRTTSTTTVATTTKKRTSIPQLLLTPFLPNFKIRFMEPIIMLRTRATTRPR